MRPLALLSLLIFLAAAGARSDVPAGVTFTVRSARSGPWADPRTWAERRVPKAGDLVQVRPGHAVTYDVDSGELIRMIHVAGTLTFARDRSTRLDVGLIKIQAGETATEDGFACDAHTDPLPVDDRLPRPALEIGTPNRPIPARVTARIRLLQFPGTDRETLPAIIDCGGRWDVHGAPLSRTWVKLGSEARPGDTRVSLSEPVTGWERGDHVIVTASREIEGGASYSGGKGNTEERTVTAVEPAALVLDRPLRFPHYGTGEYRSEVADLSRNVIIESGNPDGVRGHTMYHLNSEGGISYAEFRHLGKEGVLGKYSIHFHLVRDSMRGSGVLGASIWDSKNRWITIHGTDYLLVRDCVGYQSLGHGFFLEDGTEQYNVLDRNLAVQAYRGKPLPKQVLPFDPNDGAGFWWSNGRNSFTRNVACENDEYGYRFDVEKRSNFDPVLFLRMPDGSQEKHDIRTLPFLRFEENELHSEGLYSFNFGEDVNASVRGDREHPFIARSLKAWETHYTLRPDLQFFLMAGLKVDRAAYGVYHPDYDAHVYRNIYLSRVDGEPINRGHDDDSIQFGTFSYENLVMENCRVGRDPLIQLTCTSPKPGQSGHFRNLTIKDSYSRQGQVVDLGGGPRNPKLENSVSYYFHDYFGPGRVTRVVSAHFPEMLKEGGFAPVEGFTGRDVVARDEKDVPFPALLAPVDDLPPATMITSVTRSGGRLLVRGVSEDNDEVAAVTVNGQPAAITANRCGIADWEVSLAGPHSGALVAEARDRAGNREKLPHRYAVP